MDAALTRQWLKHVTLTALMTLNEKRFLLLEFAALNRRRALYSRCSNQHTRAAVSSMRTCTLRRIAARRRIERNARMSLAVSLLVTVTAKPAQAARILIYICRNTRSISKQRN